MNSPKTRNTAIGIYNADRLKLNLITLSKILLAVLFISLFYFDFKNRQDHHGFYSITSYKVLVFPIIGIGLIYHSLSTHQIKSIAIRDGYLLIVTYSILKGIKEKSIHIADLSFSAKQSYLKYPVFRKLQIDLFERGEKAHSLSSSVFGPKKRHLRKLIGALKKENEGLSY